MFVCISLNKSINESDKPTNKSEVHKIIKEYFIHLVFL